jgi:hypothetical protein
MLSVDLNQVPHHSAIDEITNVVCNRTQNTDRGFFDVLVAFFLAKIATSMRVTVHTDDRGQIPTNIFTIALGPSGTGKGYGTYTLEHDFLRGFKNTFMNETFPVVSEDWLWSMANERALRKTDGDPEVEKKKLDLDFQSLGALPFTFDSGTAPAVKQLRQKLLMANCGAINLQVDEIGSNLVGQTEILNVFLELYDQGMTKNKLVKNTADNRRGEELDGKTPTNMLLFGTPSKLLDGGPTEEAFYSFLETGYARRCLFGIGQRIRAHETLTAAQIYDRLTDPSNEAVIQKWHDHFASLANPNKFGWRVNVDRTVAVELMEYKIQCERLADALPEHEEIQKSELAHRYFKALKLAGIYAFIDESIEMEMIHLHQAIKLVEQSGDCFKSILRREKTYVKLAKFLMGTKGVEQTHADLVEALPFYPTSGARRTELMVLAQGWAYKNHGLIKKTFLEGIEFYSGETLEETDLEKVTLSYSDHMAYNYLGDRAPFERLHELMALPGYHWCNHHFTNKHRSTDTAIPGFDLLVLDVDGTMPMATVHDMMADYRFLTHTTKRHGEDGKDRFRMILPITHRLLLDKDDYTEFMDNVRTWLPFEVDPSVNEIAKKWMTTPGCQHLYNEGRLLDVLQFIPKTSKNEAYQAAFEKVANLDGLERWFASKMEAGSRNNHMIRYAMALVDLGLPYAEIESRVMTLNGAIKAPLLEDELRNTVLLTVAKKLAGTP